MCSFSPIACAPKWRLLLLVPKPNASSLKNHHGRAHRGRSEQEVSILFPVQPSATFEHLIWHVLRPRQPLFLLPLEKTYKEERIPTEVTPASFRDQRHPPTALEWIIDSYFSSPRVFGSLFLFALVHKTGSMFPKGIELFVALPIRYLSLHVNLGGYWGETSVFRFRIGRLFVSRRLFSARRYANEGTCRFLHRSPTPNFYFLFYNKISGDCRRYVISRASLTEHCANLHRTGKRWRKERERERGFWCN